jgi:hypothetical protein
MFHIDSQLSLEDFHPDVRRCAHTGRAESDGTGSSARERDQLSEIRESSVAPGDQHVGLLRQRCDRDEVLEGIVWEIERERRTVRVGARAHEHRMAVRWRCRHHGRTYRASRTGLVLQRDGMSPSVGKGAGEGAPDEVGPPPGPNGSMSCTGPSGNAFTAADNTSRCYVSSSTRTTGCRFDSRR